MLREALAGLIPAVHPKHWQDFCSIDLDSPFESQMQMFPWSRLLMCLNRYSHSVPVSTCYYWIDLNSPVILYERRVEQAPQRLSDLTGLLPAPIIISVVSGLWISPSLHGTLARLKLPQKKLRNQQVSA